MALEPFEYPAALYCPVCDQDVEPRIVQRSAVYGSAEKPVTVPYKAAVCPVCGKTLCERDRDFAFANSTEEQNGE